MIRMAPDDRRAFEALELRVRAILPEEYRDRYEEVEPVPMGKADLKYGQDGKVAWDDIWRGFCDLAMAGGPPHKGKILLAASPAEIASDPAGHRRVVDEICRGIRMVTDLAVNLSPVPGWVRVECDTAVTAGWMARAITMENVSARCEGTCLDLPAGPQFRVEKEIRNVITAVAKTGHYWLNHTSPAQQREIADLFAAIDAESPLIQPAPVVDAALQSDIARRIQQATGLTPSEIPCDGWLGLVCPSVKAAIYMMRAMVVSNVFARREDTVLFVAINPATDPTGDAVVRATTRVHSYARIRSLL